MRKALLISFVLLPTLAAAQIPVLQVSPTALIFVVGAGQARPEAQEIRLRNTGSGALQWRATADAAWISVSPKAGTGAGVINIAIDPSRLRQGRHDAKVTIDAGDADDSPATVTITVQVGAGSQASRPAEAPPDDLTIVLTGSSGSTVPVTTSFGFNAPSGPPTSWKSSAGAPWLSTSPASGTTPAQITIRADASKLAPGDYASVLRLLDSAGQSMLDLPISFKVGAAQAAAPDAAAAPGGAKPDRPAPLTIEARSLPPATRNLPYSQAIPVKGGTPPYAIRIVEGRLPVGLVLANGAIAGTARFTGSYPITVAVTDSAKPAATITRAVMLRVVVLFTDTALSVSPAALNLLATSAQRIQRARVAVGSGRQPFDWQATSDAKWLRISPTDGISPGVLQIEASAEGLEPGAYTATITVMMEGVPNSPARIPVQLVVRK